MTVKELAQALNLTVAAGRRGLDARIQGGYAGDLLSDVFARATEGCAWFTVQTHLNIMAVAVHRALACVVVCGGYLPSPETLARSDQENIPVLTSSCNAFDLCTGLGKTFIPGPDQKGPGKQV